TTRVWAGTHDTRPENWTACPLAEAPAGIAVQSRRAASATPTGVRSAFLMTLPPSQSVPHRLSPPLSTPGRRPSVSTRRGDRPPGAAPSDGATGGLPRASVTEGDR